MVLPLLAAGAASITGGAMSLVGGAMSLGGGLLMAGSTIAQMGMSAAGGLAGAAGGLLGGGESGNVYKDEDGEGERVFGAERFGSRGNANKTPGGGAGRQAIVIPQNNMLGSQSSALAETEGSSPQDVLMSIFESIKQSLLSIDSTLKQMLNVDRSSLAMDERDNIRDNLEKNDKDTDKEKPPKGPGFFSRVGTAARDRLKQAEGGKLSKSLKLLGLVGLIALFNKYKEQITEAFSKVIGYFFELEKTFDEGGFPAVFEKLKTDLVAISEKILPIMKSFFEDTIMPMLRDFFGWALNLAKNAALGIVGLDSPQNTKEQIEKLVEEETAIKDREDRIDSGESNAIDTLKSGVSTFGDYRAIVARKRKITRDSRGVITWTEDLITKEGAYPPPSERLKAINAKPVVNGIIYPDVSSIPKDVLKEAENIGTDYDAVTDLGANLLPRNENLPTLAGSYSAKGTTAADISFTEDLVTLREEMQIHLAKIADGSRTYFDGVLAPLASRGKRVKEIQSEIVQLGGVVTNPYEYKKFKENPKDLINYNTQRLNTLQSERVNLEMSDVGKAPLQVYNAPTTNNTSVASETSGFTSARAAGIDSSGAALSESSFRDHRFDN